MDNIEALARDWLEAKRAEGQANRQRIAIEKQIAEALDVPGEGSKTHTLDNFKVTLTQPVTRKLDADIWDEVKHRIPAHNHPVVMKPSVDTTGVKWLIKNEPETWNSIAAAFTTKPGKIGVKVEEL
jgi:hypothetical protein